MSSARPKQLIRIGGKSLVEHCVDAFAESGAVDDVTLVVRSDQIDEVRGLLADRSIVKRVVAGGDTRAASVRAGLDAVPGGADTGVVIHDGARPLVAPELIGAVVEALKTAEAVTIAIPMSDTVLDVEDGVVEAVPHRSRLLRAQTPQGFHLGTLRAAHDLAAADPEFTPTDDTGVVARYLPERSIEVIPGSERNIKLTNDADLAALEFLLGAPGAERT